MPRKLNHIIRESLKLQRLKRKLKSKTGEAGITFLASVNGSVEGTRSGHYWVHDANGVDNTGATTYGAAYQLPILPGAVIDPRPDLKVQTIVQDGTRYVARMSFSEMIKMGYDPHQTNLLAPSRKWVLIEQLQNLQSYPNGSGLTVRVMPSIYRKSDGNYAFYAGSTSVDLTSYVPSGSNMQSVVCLWLQESDGSITVTASSELSRDTDLKNDPATAMTYINEAAADAPANTIGLTCYILYDDTTDVLGINKFHDLRGILGTGGGGTSASDLSTRFEPLTDGDEASPELIFVGGDVVMIEVAA